MAWVIRKEEEEEDFIPLESELPAQSQWVERPAEIQPAPAPQFETEPGTTFATEESEARNQGRGPTVVEPVETVAPEAEPTQWQERKEEPTVWRANHNVGIVTAYRPGGTTSMGLSPTMEGGNVDAHGEPILGRTTMEDYAQGNGDYVTVAMDKTSPWQNQFLSLANFPRHSLSCS